MNLILVFFLRLPNLVQNLIFLLLFLQSILQLFYLPVIPVVGLSTLTNCLFPQTLLVLPQFLLSPLVLLLEPKHSQPQLRNELLHLLDHQILIQVFLGLYIVLHSSESIQVIFSVLVGVVGRFVEEGEGFQFAHFEEVNDLF